VIRGLLFLLRLLLVLLVVRLVVRGLRALMRPAPRPRRISDVDTVRDRICNTFVPRDKAVTATIAGREEYFCSPACRDRAAALAEAS
jgi:YHS domain-containing protein